MPQRPSDRERNGSAHDQRQDREQRRDHHERGEEAAVGHIPLAGLPEPACEFSDAVALGEVAGFCLGEPEARHRHGRNFRAARVQNQIRDGPGPGVAHLCRMTTEPKHPNDPKTGSEPAKVASEPAKALLARQASSTEAWSQAIEPDGLIQLREILFGATVRELERRLQRADAHLVARAQELELEHRRRVDVVENHLRKEAQMLGTRFERESTEKSEAIRAVAREQREAATALEQRMSKLEDSMLRVQRELRDQLLEQAKQFLDELHQLRRELAETFEREFGLAQRMLAEEAGYGAEPPAAH
jgi:hypothetical protein